MPETVNKIYKISDEYLSENNIHETAPGSSENEYSHGGNLRHVSDVYGVAPSSIIDFSSNINPLGPPENFRAHIARSLEKIVSYPDPESLNLRRSIAGYLIDTVFSDRKNSSEKITHPVSAECDSPSFGIFEKSIHENYFSVSNILPGNGLSELIHVLPRSLNPGRILICEPSYSGYRRAARSSAIPVLDILSDDNFDLNYDALRKQLVPCDMVFAGHPSNPSGRLLKMDEMENLIRDFPDVYFVVDEAFIDFSFEAKSFLASGLSKNLILLRSFTKIFAIPGLRTGCMVADSEIIRKVAAQLPEWNVNTISQLLTVNFLEDRNFLLRTVELVNEYKERLYSGLRGMDMIHVYESCGPYFLLRIRNSSLNAHDLYERLIRDYGILIRNCHNYTGLDARYFRIAVRDHSDNEKLLNALSEIFEKKSKPSAYKKSGKTPSLMIQGTSSNAGKSLLVSAFCRILLQDGIRVAPFKAQNMALNSYVTRDGREIARAQAVQASACRLEADIRMSPVLLKPNSENGSQVLLNGKPIGNMKAAEYQKLKGSIFDEIKKNYDSLSSEFDAVILEGAGSPGEVNLKKNDVVNMNMARHAEAPVLIAGDIDRGGVFAGFAGTMDVLDEWSRRLVAGFLVNKFRGDESLLEEALNYTRMHTGRPVLGVIPFLADIRIPEEDSVSFKSGIYEKKSNDRESIDIALIDLPCISNFTDFDPFHDESDVNFRIVRDSSSIGNPDVIIIPGTKNTFHDLLYLKNGGFIDRMAELRKTGSVEFVGICGGLQILGKCIFDPFGMESSEGRTEGMGFLEIETVHAEEKILRRTEGIHAPSGISVCGYEIHHGITRKMNGSSVKEILITGNEAVGFSSPSENVWGVYMHGIFDNDDFRRWFIDKIRIRKNLLPANSVKSHFSLDKEFDRLADAVRGSVDMKKIYEIMGL